MTMVMTKNKIKIKPYALKYRSLFIFLVVLFDCFAIETKHEIMCCLVEDDKREVSVSKFVVVVVV